MTIFHLIPAIMSVISNRPYTTNDLLQRCTQYKIKTEDCMGSVYLPKKEFDDYIESFHLPVFKDPSCATNMCYVVVYKDPGHVVVDPNPEEKIKKITEIKNTSTSIQQAVTEIITKTITLPASITTETTTKDVTTKEKSMIIQSTPSTESASTNISTIIITTTDISTLASLTTVIDSITLSTTVTDSITLSTTITDAVTLTSFKTITDSETLVKTITNSATLTRTIIDSTTVKDSITVKDTAIHTSTKILTSDAQLISPISENMINPDIITQKITSDTSSSILTSTIPPSISPTIITVTRYIPKTTTVEVPVTLYREFTTTSIKDNPITNYKITTITETTTLTKSSTLTEIFSSIVTSKILTPSISTVTIKETTTFSKPDSVKTITLSPEKLVSPIKELEKEYNEPEKNTVIENEDKKEKDEIINKTDTIEKDESKELVGLLKQLLKSEEKEVSVSTYTKFLTTTATALKTTTEKEIKTIKKTRTLYKTRTKLGDKTPTSTVVNTIYAYKNNLKCTNPNRKRKTTDKCYDEVISTVYVYE
ncbi:hypothetical protein TCON_0547 [Astathelohania contejeani]|uniref:Zonadhesin n=1 Tax=Astathelohania contejeani TaxID=164912 RepID=A0ABQ7I1B2_9MICR|nr:hypothetical protein TCON_0547 [Thelohania contejeani]